MVDLSGRLDRDDRQSVAGEEITVEVGGRSLVGWETVKVSQSIEAISGAFSLTVSHRLPWPIIPGQSVVVRVGDERLIDGFVDDLSAKTSSTSRTLRVSGRDKTQDLIDCSATLEPSEFNDLPLVELVAQIAAPFGIEVEDALQNTGPNAALFERFSIQPGETAFSAIERACRARAVLSFTTGNGKVTLANPSTRFADVPLLEGVRGNVKSSTINVRRRQRFSAYTVKSQRRGSDDGWGETVAEIEGFATDPEITRFRPLLVLAEGSLTFESAQDRAQWEATVRASRASTIDVDVQGWLQSGKGSRLWSINEKVKVRIPSQQVDTLLLIRSLQFQRSGAGTVTKIGLTRTDAYTPQPEIPTEDEPFRDLLDGEGTLLDFDDEEGEG